jgi:hypothetical protein
VETSEGRFIAWGWYDEKSHIPLHLLSWDEADVIDDLWWEDRIRMPWCGAPASSGQTYDNHHVPDHLSEADMLPDWSLMCMAR